MQSWSKSFVLEFPVEAVYSTWLSESALVSPATRVEIDPKVGDIYKLVTSGDATMEGVFSEVRPNQSLRYSWQWIGTDEATEVEVMFQDHPAGTDLRITHSRFQSQESLQNHAQGWESYVAGPAKILQEGA